MKRPPKPGLFWRKSHPIREMSARPALCKGCHAPFMRGELDPEGYCFECLDIEELPKSMLAPPEIWEEEE